MREKRELVNLWVVFHGHTPGNVYCHASKAADEVRVWDGQRTVEQFVPAERIRELIDRKREHYHQLEFQPTPPPWHEFSADLLFEMLKLISTEENAT